MVENTLTNWYNTNIFLAYELSDIETLRVSTAQQEDNDDGKHRATFSYIVELEEIEYW